MQVITLIHITKIFALLIASYLFCGCCAIGDGRALKSYEINVSENERVDKIVKENTLSLKFQHAIRRLYAKNPRLAGIIFFDVDGDPGASENNCSIEYVFWNGKSHQVVFNNDGHIIAEGKSEKPASEDFWDLVDFSYGSDQKFTMHNDPRLNKKTQGSR